MLRTFSYGGGVQSTAALVLAAEGRIDFRTFLFANVGDDSEHPATLRYISEVAIPYAEAHDLTIEELRRHRPIKGDYQTLYQRLTREGSRSLPIPVRMSTTGAPGRRSCTGDHKIDVIGKWLKARGATVKEPAHVGIGISLDEIRRMRTPTDPRAPYQWREYPLIDLRLTRQDCIQIIKGAGLAIPPRSSCYFCPFHTIAAWQHQRENEPELFRKSVALEKLLNERRATIGKDPVWFTDKLVPLEQATSPHRQLPMFGAEITEDACESGYCMT